MSSPPDIIITRCSVTGPAQDPNYRQTVVCGRHEMLADEPVARGGQDAGPEPFAYLLASLGSCTSITLRMYAERKGWNIGTVAVSLVLREGAAGKTIERRVTLSESLDAAQNAKMSEVCKRTPVTLAVKSGIDMHTTIESKAPTPL
jgi:putative redox protein